MNNHFHSLALVTVTFLLVLTSCSKEEPVTPNVSVNLRQPVAPTAHAGNDLTLYPPFSNYLLDGSNSTDSDNNIVSYNWKVLRSPSALELNGNGSSRVNVSGLNKIGNHEFELTVTDADNLFSKDTVVITMAEPRCTTPNGEIIFKNLSWNYSWIMEINIDKFFLYLPSNSYIMNIYIMRDSSDKLENVVHYLDDHQGYSKHTWSYGNGMLVIYPNQNMQNDTPDIKIEYCN